MFQSPVNNVIVKIKTKLIGHYSNIIKAANLNPGSQLNPADLVQIFGEIVSLPKSISKDATHKGFTTKDMRVGDGCLFRYDVVFSFTPKPGNEVPLYKNMIAYKEHEFWKADICQIFAVIRDGEIIMVNGYVMIESLSPENTIVIPQSMQRITKAATATISHIGNNLEGLKKVDVEQGDLVYFNRSMAQHYSIPKAGTDDYRKFSIIRQREVYGKEVPVLI